MICVGLLSASCDRLLSTIDVMIAAAVQALGCPRCGGALYAAHYHRKTRGTSDDDGPARHLRLSWCCGREGCRTRITPPSVRFLGQHVYAGCSIAALQCTPVHSDSERQLRQETGCSRQSMTRWRDRFQERWKSGMGRVIAAHLPRDVSQRQNPRRVLNCWIGRWPYQVVRWHLLIHAWTGGRHWPPDAYRYEPINAQKMDFASQLHDLQAARCTF